MKKIFASAAIAGSLGAALIGVSAPNASAATTQAYVHDGGAFTTKVACDADNKAFIAQVKSAGDTVVTATNLNQQASACLVTDQGWVHVNPYYGIKQLSSADFAATKVPASLGDDNAASRAYYSLQTQSDAVASHLGKYSTTTYDHAYRFASSADCLSHFNSVDKSLKANSGVGNIIDNMYVGDDLTPLQECQKDSSAPSNVAYGYEVKYDLNHNLTAPFGYEKTVTAQTFINNILFSGKTDVNGKWVKVS